jgi:hypothetical protein
MRGREMLEVLVRHAPEHMSHHVGKRGQVAGLLGTFILVKFEGSDNRHAFLPIELVEAKI